MENTLENRYNILMTTPYNHFKWLEDRFARIEKRLNEISKKQTELAKTQQNMRERALRIDKITLETDRLLNGLFTDRCDRIEGTLLNHLGRIDGLEAKVLPDLAKDMHKLRTVVPKWNEEPSLNQLDKRKPRKTK
jgi:hypothetical protein